MNPDAGAVATGDPLWTSRPPQTSSRWPTKTDAFGRRLGYRYPSLWLISSLRCQIFHPCADAERKMVLFFTEQGPGSTQVGNRTQRRRPRRHQTRGNQIDGGARRDRTDDLMLAKHALSQLSYGPYPYGSYLRLQDQQRLRLPVGPPDQPLKVVGLGRFELPTSRLSSARSNQLSYRPKVRNLGNRVFRVKKEKRRRRRPA